MTLTLLLLIVVSVSLSAVAQLVLKVGMGQPGVQNARVQGDFVDVAAATLLNPYVVGGLALYVVGALVWLSVLARIDVSVAYPFVGLGFVMTMLLGAVLLGETVGISRVIGTFLIVCGVVLVARSA